LVKSRSVRRSVRPRSARISQIAEAMLMQMSSVPSAISAGVSETRARAERTAPAAMRR